MRGTVLYGPGDVRFEERVAPAIIEPTDAIVRTSLTCVCGSDLWPYHGANPIMQPAAALVAVPLLLKGREAWRGHSCGCS